MVSFLIKSFCSIQNNWTKKTQNKKYIYYFYIIYIYLYILFYFLTRLITTNKKDLNTFFCFKLSNKFENLSNRHTHTRKQSKASIGNQIKLHFSFKSQLNTRHVITYTYLLSTEYKFSTYLHVLNRTLESTMKRHLWTYPCYMLKTKQWLHIL